MESNEAKDSSQCVRVAVNIRPLVTPELLVGCTDVITFIPGEPQVQIGSHAFTFDYVFGSGALSSSKIFDECVSPLVDALFHGYNGTVLAYGQTGSGKTYTMGTNYNGEDSKDGVIPKVMEAIFSKVKSMKESTELLIRVSFIEIFKEEVYDLLDSNQQTVSKCDGALSTKQTVPVRPPIQIRETMNGGITLAGVTEAEVRSKEEMAAFLLRGSVARATGSTNMNSQSSRSHAIFTISMEQKRISSCPTGQMNEEDILCAKLHLVDLAGSERAKRTGADGMRLREGIHINKGLLALGNVISALGDEKKRKEGGHVPYRDSKLTRLLQDSLGGNSKTVMIACVSPADTNAEETLNTLKYANRARNIQNKAIINRDPMTAQLQRMRSQIEQLQTELSFFRGDSATPFEELQILKHKISLLEASNTELRRELHERQISSEHLTQRAIDAQVERDRLIMKIESARNGKPWDEIEDSTNEEVDLVKKYVAEIQELEGQVLRLQSSKSSKHGDLMDYLEMDSDRPHSETSFLAESEIRGPVDITGNIEDEAKEIEHSSLQEQLDGELKELDRKLEQKEAEMKRVAGLDTSVLKQQFERKVQELELEKRCLQKEIEGLRHNLASISSTSDDGAQKLKQEYLQKLNLLESQVAELKKKQDAQAQLLRQKQKSDEAAKRLQDEIHRIKTQKVQLQQKIKQESEQFRLWRASRDKEVLQLKKEGRRNEYEMHKLLALNQRQKMVLQRKTEEAAMASKRLKEVLEPRKPPRDLSGNSRGPSSQALMQAIEHELEVTTRVHEVRSKYERQMEERAKMAKELGELKEEAQMQKERNLSDCVQTMSPGARNSRIFALENMLATSSSTLVSMASHLSEAEERERAFNGKGRWNQVRSLADAKNIMNFLFNLASSSRCKIKDREVDCREKDSEIRDLKEKVVQLINILEMQKAEFMREKMMMKMVAKKRYKGETGVSNDGEGHVYDLRQEIRKSMVFNYGSNNEILEDMDISDTEYEPDVDQVDDDVEWEKTKEKKLTRAKKNKSVISSSVKDLKEMITEAAGADEEKTHENVSDVCCSCSKSSQCKTQKCECRAVKGNCGINCGCTASRCSNRESGTDEIATQAIQGAMLLQTALTGNTNDQTEAKRKPLSDIGNALDKPNIPKPGPRKQWRRKSVNIQLVTADPPSSQSETGEGSVKEESNNNVGVGTGGDVSLRLPISIRAAQTNNNNALRERNRDEESDVIVVNKDSGVGESSSPRRIVKTTKEKENQGI